MEGKQENKVLGELLDVVKLQLWAGICHHDLHAIPFKQPFQLFTESTERDSQP